MTADLSGQGGPPPHQTGTIVGTVWLKNGIYTYRYVVTPTENGTRQFLSQFHIAGFDPAVHKIGWSYTDATAAGVSGNPSTAFQIIYTLHNNNAMILNYFMPASQASAGFWTGINLHPITFFFQSTRAPDVTLWGLLGVDGATAVNYAPSLIAATYEGKLRDRVGPGNTALSADGAPDGTLSVNLNAPGGRTITHAQLQSSAPGMWDTDSATSFWALGAANTLDGALLNSPTTMAVNFAVADGGSFTLFAADYADTEFVPGTTLTVTVTFSDATTAAVSLVVAADASANPPSIAVTYDGKLRDRVGAGSLALGADGAPDGTFTVTLSAAGGRHHRARAAAKQRLWNLGYHRRDGLLGRRRGGHARWRTAERPGDDGRQFSGRRWRQLPPLRGRLCRDRVCFRHHAHRHRGLLGRLHGIGDDGRGCDRSTSLPGRDL